MVYIKGIERVSHTKGDMDHVRNMSRPKTRKQRLKERIEHNIEHKRLMRLKRIKSLTHTFLEWKVGMGLMERD